MSEKVYKWECYFGRGGDLEGLFVAKEKHVEAALGKTALFHEALGKHSQPQTTLIAEQFKALSDDPKVIEFVREHANTGYNPLDYVHLQCNVCDVYMNPEEVMTYICKTHNVDLCDGCVEKKDHADCETAELEIDE